MIFRVIVPVLALVLAACGEEPEATMADDTDGAAEGEVLGGTISDAMLPIDSVQSQSPTVEPRRSSAGSDAAASSDGEDTAAAASDASETSEPTGAAEPVLETGPATSEEAG